MKEIKLRARLSAYSKVDSITTNVNIQDATKCDVDELFGEGCTDIPPIITSENEVSCADIDALFK